MTHTISFFIYIFWALLFLKTHINCLNICCLLCILGKESNTVGWIFSRQGGNPPLTKQICLLLTLGYFGLRRCKPNFPSGLILLNDPLILTLDGSNSQFYDTGSYLIFVIFLLGQIFWRIKFTPKNANFSR